MKHLYTLFAFAASTLLFLTSFLSCTTDEAEEAKTQEQILLQKSKEFAQKYGIDMMLNEDKLSEAVKDGLTVEQMEADYKEAAQHTFVFHQKSTSSFSTKNKIKLRKTAPQFETTDVSGIIEFYSEDIHVYALYKMGNKGGGTVHVTIEDGSREGSATFMMQGATSVGSTTCDFSASGTIFVQGSYYTYVYYVTLYKTGIYSGGTVSVSKHR